MVVRRKKIGEESWELRGIERGKEIGKEIVNEIGALENARNYFKTVLKTRLGDIPI